MASSAHIEWRDDPYWRRRRLCPSQLLVHDIGVSQTAESLGPVLENNEVLPSSFLLALQDRDRLSTWLSMNAEFSKAHEHEELRRLVNEYGWMNCLRLPELSKDAPLVEQQRSCRWIHIPSKFPEYLHGCLLGLSDWSDGNVIPKIMTNRLLGQIINQNERFSKHGRYFSPFLESLALNFDVEEQEQNQSPLLLSVPFIDWAVAGEPPPLRFQIDPREGYLSSRSSSHMLRTLLQHFYRLEDTKDRERNQVFTNHKPWSIDNLLDLKVRRWYGHYPESLNVDELWILVVDARHIVTFSSNQSWKSRWPPLQLASRIAEVSFRYVRNDFFMGHTAGYTAYQHIATCLNGAVGLLHRSFWPDIPLCLSDRYAGYLEHVQYRLHRAPSPKLVMELLQLQDELDIVLQITKHQLDLITGLQSWLNRELQAHTSQDDSPPFRNSVQSRERRASRVKLLPQAYWSTLRQHGSPQRRDPVSQLLGNLNREYSDLFDLRESTSNAVDRTVKLVNLRLEYHGKAILAFTIVTVIFLPLSFISSFFGMNFVDIRNTDRSQGYFWIVAGSATVGIVALSTLVAFMGSPILEQLLDWSDNRRRRRRDEREKEARSFQPGPLGIKNFEVISAAKL